MNDMLEKIKSIESVDELVALYKEHQDTVGKAYERVKAIDAEIDKLREESAELSNKHDGFCTNISSAIIDKIGELMVGGGV